jgi:hypothetical protein
MTLQKGLMIDKLEVLVLMQSLSRKPSRSLLQGGVSANMAESCANYRSIISASVAIRKGRPGWRQANCLRRGSMVATVRPERFT